MLWVLLRFENLSDKTENKSLTSFQIVKDLFSITASCGKAVAKYQHNKKEAY